MSAHNTVQQLQEAQNSQGRIFLLNAGVPTASVAGFSIGALAIDTVNGKLYINIGTAASANWQVVGAQS